MPEFATAMAITALSLSCIAILLSCVAIAVVVGFKNSTHRIEWKTLNTHTPDDGEDEDEEEEGPEMLENPNKRIRRNAPFQPFPPAPAEEEPFFNEEDPNNTSHDY